MITRTLILYSFIIVFLFLFPGTISAGTSYDLQCKTPECEWKTSVDFGGGFVFEKITGYCNSCKKFVYINWKREELKPSSTGTIWDFSTGTLKEFYLCPVCGNPFLSINSIDNIRYCPKCGKESLTHTISILYD